jgi:hypothetical protein
MHRLLGQKLGCNPDALALRRFDSYTMHLGRESKLSPFPDFDNWGMK